MAQVELRNISKSFGGNSVIADCNLNVEDREFLVLVGPSGCGKSTLLRMVAGLESATDGEIFIGGQPVNQLPPKDRDIAMVFQNYALYPHMTVRKNMGFGLKMRKYPKGEIEKRVLAAAKILEIEHLLDRRPAQLSGGQRQRVAMGRAIVRKPAVFLFDEPLSNLDAKLRVQMRLEIKKLHEKIRTTVFYVTHDQVEAMTLADRIAIINSGKIQQLGTPDQIYKHPANRFVAEFIGSPPMNFFDAEVAPSGKIVAGDLFSLPLPACLDAKSAAGRKITLGLRPESLHAEGVNGGDSSIRGRVELVEPLGPSTVLICNSGGLRYSISAPADSPYRVGDELVAGFSWDQAHLFDSETGKNLTSVEASADTEDSEME